MKSIIVALFLCGVVLAEDREFTCAQKKQEIVTDPQWADMADPCIMSMRQQIKAELEASMQYLAMGAHFSRDMKNRPGFAKMFFEAASEERQHGIKLISYLLMRGELTSFKNRTSANVLFEPFDPYNGVKVVEWGTGMAALKDALQLEAQVTQKIKGVIKECEKDPNDYHLVDYLTGEFLEEQYKGQRDIAGKISTLSKFMSRHGALGEFLYDKELLKGE